MKKPPPQFLQDEHAASFTRKSRGSNLAIYRLPKKDRDGNPITIAVECVDGGGNVPRNAASIRNVTAEIQIDLEKEFERVAAMADVVLHSLKAMQPGEVEIEFGIELGGQMGIPFVAKGEAKANFKVTMKWKDGRKSE